MVRLMICLSALLLGGGADLLSARGRELVAGSYNIRCDTPVDGDNAWPYRKERVEALIRFYGFDVLGVQEAKPSQMSDLHTMPGFASVGVGRDGGDRGEYSAIFYRTDRLRDDGAEKGEFMAVYYLRDRFELLDSGTFWLSETPDTVSKGWDAALNRICTWAKMKERRTGRVFYFFNTHFDHVGREARLRSAELLAGRIRAVAGDKYPVLCTGDFNAHAESEPVAVMKTVLRDAREASQTPAYGPSFSYAGFPVQVSEKLRNRTPIDYLFVSGRVRVLTCGLLSDSDGRNHPSDHFPLRAVIVFD